MKKIHLIGINGIGMSALAQIFLENGIAVSGSDLSSGSTTLKLKEMGANIYEAHKPENISEDIDEVIISAAIKGSNKELEEALRRKIPVLTYAEALGREMGKNKGIAVAGTHGKSTTSGMLTYLLKSADLDPTYVVGAVVKQLNTNGSNGSGEYFVAEACEYAESFLKLCPYYAIITNIEEDHLDYYKDFSDIIKAFKNFIALVNKKGFLLIDKDASEYVGEINCCYQTYSLQDKTADWYIDNIEKKEDCGYKFSVWNKGRKIDHFENKLLGMHNLHNTLSVIALAYNLGIEVEKIKKSIKDYEGVKRRMEVLIEKPFIVIDDYGHHPTEIKAVLEALRSFYGEKNIWCIFQPHQASRTFYFLENFAEALMGADEIVITDIFYSRDKKEDKDKVSAENLVELIVSRKKSARYIKKECALEFLRNSIKNEDILLIMGAGDINSLSSQIVSELA